MKLHLAFFKAAACLRDFLTCQYLAVGAFSSQHFP